MRAKLILPAALLLLASCDEAPTRTGETSGGEILAPTRLEGMPRQSTGITAERRLVIRTQGELEAFWAEMLRDRPYFAPPEIDFASEMVVAAAMGPRANLGYRVTLESLAREGARWNAVVLSRSPGSCMAQDMATSPVDAMRVPRAAEVRFEERTDVASCTP